MRKVAKAKAQDKNFRVLGSRGDIVKMLVANGITPGSENPYLAYEQAKKLIFEGRRLSPQSYEMTIRWICDFLRI